MENKTNSCFAQKAGKQLFLLRELVLRRLQFLFKIFEPIVITHCRDGTCVPQEEVCDGKMDCDDKSDELDCQTIKFDKTYLKTLPPPPIDDDSETPMNVTILIDSILDVDVVHSNFKLQLRSLSVTNNSVGSRSTAACHVGNSSSAHVARNGRSRTDAVLHN